MTYTKAYLAAAALAVAAAPVAIAQKPDSVDLRASATTITHSQPVQLTGKVDKSGAGTKVVLQSRRSTSQTWRQAGETLTTNGGRFTFGHRPRVNTYYRVATVAQPPVVSPEVLVQVAPLVGFRVSDLTPSRGQRVRFFGIVRPRHDGRRVSVERQDSAGSWIVVRRPELRRLDSRSSRYSTRLRIRRTANYRIRIAGHADHVEGFSRTRTLTVGG